MASQLSVVSLYALTSMLILSAHGGVRVCHGCSTQCQAFYTACAFQATVDLHPSDCCATGINCSLYTCPGIDCDVRLAQDLLTACNNCMTSKGINDAAACTAGGAVMAVDCLSP